MKCVVTPKSRKGASKSDFFRYYPNVTIRYVWVFAVAITSVVCLSVMLVQPTQGVEAFDKISSTPMRSIEWRYFQ